MFRVKGKRANTVNINIIIYKLLFVSHNLGSENNSFKSSTNTQKTIYSIYEV